MDQDLKNHINERWDQVHKIWPNTKTIIDNLFGAWTAKAFNTNYQAATAGLVVAYIDASASDADETNLVAKTDGSSPPTTVRAGASAARQDGDNIYLPYASLMMPVRKGDYWRIDKTDTGGAGTSGVWWVALQT